MGLLRLVLVVIAVFVVTAVVRVIVGSRAGPSDTDRYDHNGP